MGSPIEPIIAVGEELLKEAPLLTLLDRCDATANGVEAAQVIVHVGDTDILLCGHHYAKHKHKFSNYRITDTRIGQEDG